MLNESNLYNLNLFFNFCPFAFALVFVIGIVRNQFLLLGKHLLMPFLFQPLDFLELKALAGKGNFGVLGCKIPLG